MKLIIDINDKMFDTFKKNGIMTFDGLDEYDKDTLARIIANGIPYERPQGENKPLNWLDRCDDDHLSDN